MVIHASSARTARPARRRGEGKRKPPKISNMLFTFIPIYTQEEKNKKKGGKRKKRKGGKSSITRLLDRASLSGRPVAEEEKKIGWVRQN